MHFLTFWADERKCQDSFSSPMSTCFCQTFVIFFCQTVAIFFCHFFCGFFSECAGTAFFCMKDGRLSVLPRQGCGGNTRNPMVVGGCSPPSGFPVTPMFRSRFFSVPTALKFFSLHQAFRKGPGPGPQTFGHYPPPPEGGRQQGVERKFKAKGKNTTPQTQILQSKKTQKTLRVFFW